MLASVSGAVAAAPYPGRTASPKLETIGQVPSSAVPRIGSGGEDFAGATVIAALPYQDTGNTCGALDDYDPACALAGNSAAPDLVYVYRPAADVCVDIDVCGSNYDTALHVYANNAASPVACSDDFCGLQSRLANLHLSAGTDYYIVVDGWSSGCGDYVLRVATTNPTLGGWINYYEPSPLPNTNHVPDVQVCLDVPSPGICTTSDALGGYKLPGTEGGTATLEASRSTTATDEGALGGGDVTLLIDYLAGSTSLTPEQQQAADVDGSGIPPNVDDLQRLRRFLVFDISACPGCAAWEFTCDPRGTPAAVPCSVDLSTCANDTLDLQGLLRGDVDSSWPNRYKVHEAAPAAVDFGPATWNEAILTLPVVARTGAAPLRSMIFSISYDDAVLEFVGAVPLAAARGHDFALNARIPGVLHGLVSGGTTQPGAVETLVALRFRDRGTPGAATRLSFSRLYANDQEPARNPEILVSRQGQTESLPQRFEMAAVPNPFNPSTRIEYAIPDGSGVVTVEVRVLDLAGRQVRRLLQTRQGPGRYHSVWDGKSDRGGVLASGVYLVQLRAGSIVSTEKVVLLK